MVGDEVGSEVAGDVVGYSVVVGAVEVIRIGNVFVQALGLGLPTVGVGKGGCRSQRRVHLLFECRG